MVKLYLEIIEYNFNHIYYYINGVKYMKKIKVMTVFGTRPEAIKMAPIIKELEKREEFESRVCVTAQHRQMLDQVMEIFKIQPDYDLDIMKNKQSLAGITCRALEGIESVIKKENPDIVLVHGDTTTTFVASLAAFYNKAKVGHVEAGLRSHDKYFPFPEEMNRKLTASIADLHFSPTELSKQNLLNENIDKKTIFVTGNTAIDAMDYTIKENYKFKEEKLNHIDYEKKVIMVTAHRRENWGEGIENICEALRSIVEENKDVELIYLVHLNPIVRDVVHEKLGGIDRIHLLDPINVEDNHNLMNKCYMIMSDSGGIQEEAPHVGKPLLVFRDVTERQEAVQVGAIKLVGTDKNKILKEANKLLKNEQEYNKMKNIKNPYGDGTTSRQICDILKKILKNESMV